MKIWYQSLSSYRYEPVWDKYGEALAEQCKRALRPDTEIYVTGTPVMVRQIDSFKSLMYYHKSQMLNNMLKAKKEGYDAFVIGCTYDSGLEEGREMLNIPVVGISQTAYYMAGLLGELFAVVTTSTYFYEFYRKQIKHYGLESKHLSGTYMFPASEEELGLAQENPEPMLNKFRVEAERAVSDGASVIVPHPAFLASLTSKAGITKIGNALVLDTVSTAVKVAEMLVDLRKIGIEVSRKLQVYGSPGKELLEESLKKYAPVFKIEY